MAILDSCNLHYLITNSPSTFTFIGNNVRVFPNTFSFLMKSITLLDCHQTCDSTSDECITWRCTIVLTNQIKVFTGIRFVFLRPNHARTHKYIYKEPLIKYDIWIYLEISAFLSEAETNRLLELAEHGRLENSDVFHYSMDTLLSQTSFELWDLNRDDVISTDEVSKTSVFSDILHKKELENASFTEL